MIQLQDEIGSKIAHINYWPKRWWVVVIELIDQKPGKQKVNWINEFKAASTVNQMTNRIKDFQQQS